MFYAEFFKALNQKGVPNDLAREAALVLSREYHNPERIRSQQEQRIISDAWEYVVPKDVKGIGNS